MRLWCQCTWGIKVSLEKVNSSLTALLGSAPFPCFLSLLRVFMHTFIRTPRLSDWTQEWRVRFLQNIDKHFIALVWGFPSVLVEIKCSFLHLHLCVLVVLCQTYEDVALQERQVLHACMTQDRQHSGGVNCRKVMFWWMICIIPCRGCAANPLCSITETLQTLYFG